MTLQIWYVKLVKKVEMPARLATRCSVSVFQMRSASSHSNSTIVTFSPSSEKYDLWATWPGTLLASSLMRFAMTLYSSFACGSRRVRKTVTIMIGRPLLVGLTLGLLKPASWVAAFGATRRPNILPIAEAGTLAAKTRESFHCRVYGLQNLHGVPATCEDR